MKKVYNDWLSEADIQAAINEEKEDNLLNTPPPPTEEMEAIDRFINSTGWEGAEDLIINQLLMK